MDETRITSTAERPSGCCTWIRASRPADLSAGNRELLQTLAIEASTILENARLMEEERVKLRMESELKIAREIQQGLLPASLPSRMVSRRRISSPPRQVGGDYFDVAPHLAHVWAAVVADVSGKGVSSALLAGLLQGAFLMTSGESGGLEADDGAPEPFSAGAHHAARNTRRCSIAWNFAAC